MELEIDPSESFINTIPSSFNGLAFVEGKPQNDEGLGAPLSGTLVLDISSSGIKIMPESTIVVDHSETGFPGPFSGGDDTREFNQGAFLLSFSGALTPANDVGRKSSVMPVDEA